MRTFALACLLAACRTEPIATIPEPNATPVAPQRVCGSPRFDPSATCDAAEKAFWTDMANACTDSQPALADAMRAVARDVTLRTPPVGAEHWRARDRKSFTLYQASFALLPPECTTDFPAHRFPVDDYGRGVSEVSRLWQTDPRCRPFEIQGTVDIGVWSFATVLAPHLDAAGRAYLEKLVVCEER